MKKSILPSNEIIIDMYLNKNYTIDQIRKELKTTSFKISKILKNNNIKIKGNFIEIPENEVIEMYLDTNYKVEQIYKKFNVSKRKILSILHKHNIPLRHSINVSDEEITSMYLNNKYTTGQISKKLNITTSTIIKIIKKYNIKLKSNRLYSCDENIFEKIDTEEKAYWLGFLYADGCIINKTKRYYGVKLALKKSDIEHIEKFKSFMKTNSPIRYNIDKKYKSESYNISVTSKKLVKDLIDKGCIERKSLVIKFPKIDEELMRHFIRGYFDGDGTITYKSNISLGFVCGSLDFLNQLSLYLHEKLNVKKSKLYGKNKNYRSILWSSKDDMIRICHFMYENSSISLNRKKDKIEFFLKNINHIITSRSIKRNWKKSNT